MTIAAGSPIEATHQVALKIRAFEDQLIRGRTGHGSAPSPRSCCSGCWLAFRRPWQGDLGQGLQSSRESCNLLQTPAERF